MPRHVALAVAAVCALLFVVLYLFADRTLVGQKADDRAFLLVFGLVPAGWPAISLAWFARAFVVEGLAVIVFTLSVAALFRRAWGPLVRAGIVVSVSVLASPYLRDEVLVRERLRPETFPLNSMPSTHASAAVALVIAAVVLWPSDRPWWLANVAGVVVLLVALGNIVSQAHRPSDVGASLLLVAAVTATVHALTPTRRGRPR